MSLMTPAKRVLQFPDSFFFGTAVSSFQVEGHIGIRQTDWDEFLDKNQNKYSTENSGPNWWEEGVAEADIDRAAFLGTTSLRMSFEWARIEPVEGRLNHRALNRYREIIDYCHKKRIDPMITLSHFTLPLWVATKGGWENKMTEQYFLKYVTTVAAHFKDIKYWITINEPSVLLTSGYVSSFFPPQRHNLLATFTARNILLSTHKKAYTILKKTHQKSQVGIAFSFRWFRPEDQHSYPERVYTRLINFFDSKNYVHATIDTCDFIGVNFYTGYYLDLRMNKMNMRQNVRKDTAGIPSSILFGEIKKPGVYTSDMGWPIVPDFFLDVLRHIHAVWEKPCIITENGIADHKDKYRAFYILTHLTAVWRAIHDGIKVQGYEYWSIIDNLEWLYGYSKEFGLMEINPVNGQRTIRKSAQMYQEIAVTKTIDVEHVIATFLPEEQRERARMVMMKLLDTPTSEHPNINYVTP